MAIGGNFLTFNKVLPGAYINFVSKTRAISGISERGVIALPFKIDWGPEKKIFTVTASEFLKNSIKIFGYDYGSPELFAIREIFKNASEAKIFRLGSGKKATATIDDLTVTALYGGARGNSIKIKIVKPVSGDTVTVCTFMQETLVDEQTVSSVKQLVDNDFVCFSTSVDKPVVNSNAGVNLLGGTDDNLTNQAYQDFLNLIEAEAFNVLLFDGDDEISKSLFTNFTKRLRDDEGVKFTTILHNYAKANYEGVISLNGNKSFIYWLGGALASCNLNESVTNKIYDGELLVEQKFTNSQLKDFVENGEIVFYNDNYQNRVLKDINTFTNFSPEKNSDFSNNQIIRILDACANDIASVFNNFYLGKMQNDSIGRDIFKSEIIDYFSKLQSIRAIDNFVDSDIQIFKGEEKGDVILNIAIQPISCVEKLYMKCIIL